MFGTILITICTLMHLYVVWRITTIPAVKRHLPGWLIAGVLLLLWLIFFLGRTIGHHGTGPVATALEFAGMNWMAALFLIFISLLTIDILTLWGVLFRKAAPFLRGLALCAGCLMAAFALFQGMRPPVVETYNVHLKGLPADLDGTTLVAVSDLHLGSLLGKNWLSARIDQIMAIQPDMVVFLGDIFEGHGHNGKNLVPVMKRLHTQTGIPLVSTVV